MTDQEENNEAITEEEVEEEVEETAKEAEGSRDRDPAVEYVISLAMAMKMSSMLNRWLRTVAQKRVVTGDMGVTEEQLQELTGVESRLEAACSFLADRNPEFYAYAVISTGQLVDDMRKSIKKYGDEQQDNQGESQ